VSKIESCNHHTNALNGVFLLISREELAVAQATIQALKKRATELSEDSASPAASGAEAEAAELRARLRQAKDQLATSSSKNDAMQVDIECTSSHTPSPILHFPRTSHMDMNSGTGMIQSWRRASKIS
jgi:hypothetical protein